MNDELEAQLEGILVMYSDLKALFNSVEYEGDTSKAKDDVTFKGYNESTEEEYSKRTKAVIGNFGNSIYVLKNEPKQNMLPIYREMYSRYSEKRTLSLFNRDESTETERKEFIDFVVCGKK